MLARAGRRLAAPLLTSLLALVVWGCSAEPDTPPASAAAKGQNPGDAKPIVVECQSDDGLDATLREQVETRAKELHASLRTGKFDDLWKDLHPQARRDDQREPFMQALGGMQQRLSLTPMMVEVERTHVVKLSGGSSKLARVQCGGDDDPRRYGLLVNAGDEDVAVVILRSPAPMTEHVTTVSMRRRGDDWRLLGVQVNPSRYRGKNAPYYEEAADAFMKDKKVVMAYFMLGLAEILSANGESVKSMHHERVEQKLKATTRDELYAQETGTWTLGADRFEVQGFTLVAAGQEISPVVRYVSPQGLVKELLDRDADKLVEEVRRRYPELAEHFDTVVFEASATANPSGDDNAPVAGYRLVRFLDPEKRRG